jgi:hypothetical protein
MKTRKNMLRSSVAMLLVSVLALTTATYAWFTTGNGGKVEEIALTAATAAGIELSADAENWSGIITKKDLIALEDAENNKVNQMLNGESDRMEPLSSYGAVSGGVLTMYKGTISEDGTFTAEKNSGNTNNYVKFDFYVRNTNSEDATLYLDLTNASVSEVEDEDADRATGVDNAVRVAFIDQGGAGNGISIINTTDAPGDARKLTGNKTSALVWEPNDNDKAAVVNGTITSSSDKTAATVVNGVATGSSSLKVLETVNKDSTTKYVSIATIGANRISKVTVYIWLEGQDPDCTNYASGGKFNVNLVFSNKDNSQTSSSDGDQK